MKLLILIFYIICNSAFAESSYQYIAKKFKREETQKHLVEDQKEIEESDSVFFEDRTLPCLDRPVMLSLEARYGLISNLGTRSCFFFNEFLISFKSSSCNKTGMLIRCSAFYGDSILYNHHNPYNEEFIYDNSNDMFTLTITTALNQPTGNIHVRSIGRGLIQLNEDTLVLTKEVDVPLTKPLPVYSENLYINLNDMHGIKAWGMKILFEVHKNICFSRINKIIPYIPRTANNMNFGLVAGLVWDNFAPLNMPGNLLNNRLWHKTTIKDFVAGISIEGKMISDKILISPSLFILIQLYNNKSRVYGTHYGIQIKEEVTIYTGDSSNALDPPEIKPPLTTFEICEEIPTDIEFIDIGRKMQPIILSSISIAFHFSKNSYCGISPFIDYSIRSIRLDKNENYDVSKYRLDKAEEIIEHTFNVGVGIGFYYHC